MSISTDNPVTLTKRILSRLSLRVRERQFKLFLSLLKPTDKSKILDVGVTPNETLPDSNFFEKRYTYPQNLTAVSVENCQKLFKKRYPKVKFIQVKSGKPLSFPNKSFDIAVSWATIEHVGGREKQKFFLEELFRVGRKVFVTTPDKKCFYEPHSGLLFVHWLPHKYFSLICRVLGKNFWASEENLCPLTKKDILKILPRHERAKIITYKMFKIIPSHLIIIKNA